MRMLVVVALVVAGCAADDRNGEPLPEEPVYPDPISESGMVPAGAQWMCPQGCPIFPFTLADNTSVHVVLEWTVQANDLDLFVYNAAGEAAAQSTELPPVTMEAITATLGPGDYTIGVMPYAAVPGDSFTLDATFEAP